MLKQMCTFRCMLQEGRADAECLNMTWLQLSEKTFIEIFRTMDFKKRLDDTHPAVVNDGESELLKKYPIAPTHSSLGLQVCQDAVK